MLPSKKKIFIYQIATVLPIHGSAGVLHVGYHLDIVVGAVLAALNVKGEEYELDVSVRRRLDGPLAVHVVIVHQVSKGGV